VAEKSADKVTTSSCQGGEAGFVRSKRIPQRNALPTCPATALPNSSQLAPKRPYPGHASMATDAQCWEQPVIA
jgi:hypothetical protein